MDNLLWNTLIGYRIFYWTVNKDNDWKLFPNFILKNAPDLFLFYFLCVIIIISGDTAK